MTMMEELIGKDVLVMKKHDTQNKWKHLGPHRVQSVGTRIVTLLRIGPNYRISITLDELRNLRYCLVDNGVRVTIPDRTDYRAVMRGLTKAL